MKKGFILTLDAMSSLIAIVILLPILTPLMQGFWNNIQNRIVAEHFVAIQNAAILYGKQNHHLLMPQVTQTTGPAITVANLKSANVLPERFGEINAWQQGYTIVARLDTNGDLAMVVLTTGGRGHSAAEPDFANIMVPQTAAMAKAGFIPTGLLGPDTVLRGAFGAWEVPLASMGLTGTPGHLGSISTLSSADLDQDFLYRVAVPGRPELNAMQTSLDMTGHNINNVRSIGFTHLNFSSIDNFCSGAEDEGRTFLDKDQGLYLCRDGMVVLVADSGNSLMVQNKTMGWHGMLVDKPVCAVGTGLYPKIYVGQAMLAAGEEAPSISAFQAWATEHSDTQWQVHLRLKTTTHADWVYPSITYGRVEVTTTCAR
jgi:hypothetical protein